MPEDLIQYFIINEDLVDKDNKPVKMSAGKLAVQVAHVATKMAFYEGERYKEDRTLPEVGIFKEWFDSYLHKKITLRAHEKVIKRIIADINAGILVGEYTIDAGLTEIKENQITCICLFPCYKSDLPKYIQRLQLYKE